MVLSETRSPLVRRSSMFPIPPAQVGLLRSTRSIRSSGWDSLPSGTNLRYSFPAKSDTCFVYPLQWSKNQSCTERFMLLLERQRKVLLNGKKRLTEKDLSN